MLLNQFSGSGANSGDASLRALVLAAMFSTAPILRYLEFYPMTGNADSLRKGVNTTGTGQTRSIDESYSEKTTTPEWGNIALKILGDQIKTDLAHERRGGDIGSERRRQLESFGKNLGLYLQDQIVNGDGTGENISGLKTLIPAERISKFSTANGGIVPIGTTDTARKAQALFLFSLIQMTQSIKGGASVLLMNSHVKATLYAIGQGYLQTSNATDALGNLYQLASFNGIPIVDAGYKNDGTGLVMPNTATVGTSTDCTSIYALKFGEKENLTAATNTGIDVVDKGLIGVHYTTMVDFDMNMTLLDDFAVAELSGIRLEM